MLMALGLCSHCHIFYNNLKILTPKMLNPSDMILRVSLYINLQLDYDLLQMSLINAGQLLAC